MHTWVAVLGERFKTPLPPSVLRSVGVPACKGAMTEPELDSASWDQILGEKGRKKKKRKRKREYKKEYKKLKKNNITKLKKKK